MIDPERSEKIAAALRDQLRAGIEMIQFWYRLALNLECLSDRRRPVPLR